MAIPGELVGGSDTRAPFINLDLAPLMLTKGPRQSDFCRMGDASSPEPAGPRVLRLLFRHVPCDHVSHFTSVQSKLNEWITDSWNSSFRFSNEQSILIVELWFKTKSYSSLLPWPQEVFVIRIFFFIMEKLEVLVLKGLTQILRTYSISVRFWGYGGLDSVHWTIVGTFRSVGMLF